MDTAVFRRLPALHAQVGQTHDFVGHATHVVQSHGFGGVSRKVGHIVHGVDEFVDLLTIKRGDEGQMQQTVHFSGHRIRGALALSTSC